MVRSGPFKQIGPTAVPVALVVLLLDITLVWHASKTGRLQPWAFIILMVPLIGALAYVVVELVPEWFNSPDAQRARRHLSEKLDPGKRYRELSDRLLAADTIANRAALASECLVLGQFSEAERHYDHILSLPLGHDPIYALGKARAQFGANRPADAAATLDELKARWPDFQSGDGHLLYARALAAAGRIDEALEEFASVVTYFSGAEAKVRYGMLLKLLGRTAEAKLVFNEFLLQIRRAPRHARLMQAEWIAVAEKELSA